MQPKRLPTSSNHSRGSHTTDAVGVQKNRRTNSSAIVLLKNILSGRVGLFVPVIVQHEDPVNVETEKLYEINDLGTPTVTKNSQTLSDDFVPMVFLTATDQPPDIKTGNT